MAKLTDLPNELIDEIVAFVFATNPKEYLGAVHRIFLSSSRSLTFKSVWTREHDYEPARSVATLCNLLAFSPAVAFYIRALDVGRLDDDEDDEDDEDEYLLGQNQAWTLFRRLPNLEELHIHEEGLANAVLSPPTNDVVLPRLQCLKMTYEGSLFSPNPFDPRRFEDLYKYPSLDALELSITWSPHNSRGPAYKSFKGQLASKRSWWLSLAGQLVNNTAVPDLIGFFNVDSLTLKDRSSAVTETSASWAPLLRAVHRPVHLSALVLHQWASTPTTGSLVASLSRFTNLSSLELGRNTFLASHLLSLSALPNLTRLVLGPDAEVSIADLVAFVSGTTKLPALRTLRLDLVYKPSPSFCAFDPLEYCGWTSSFTFEGVGKLLDLAKKEGIKPTGLAVALVKREREYERRFGKAGSRATR